jgi:hypothetical protein
LQLLDLFGETKDRLGEVVHDPGQPNQCRIIAC